MRSLGSENQSHPLLSPITHHCYPFPTHSPILTAFLPFPSLPASPSLSATPFPLTLLMEILPQLRRKLYQMFFTLMVSFGSTILMDILPQPLREPQQMFFLHVMVSLGSALPLHNLYEILIRCFFLFFLIFMVSPGS